MSLFQKIHKVRGKSKRGNRVKVSLMSADTKIKLNYRSNSSFQTVGKEALRLISFNINTNKKSIKALRMSKLQWNKKWLKYRIPKLISKMTLISRFSLSLYRCHTLTILDKIVAIIWIDKTWNRSRATSRILITRFSTTISRSFRTCPTSFKIIACNPPIKKTS